MITIQSVLSLVLWLDGPSGSTCLRHTNKPWTRQPCAIFPSYLTLFGKKKGLMGGAGKNCRMTSCMWVEMLKTQNVPTFSLFSDPLCRVRVLAESKRERANTFNLDLLCIAMSAVKSRKEVVAGKWGRPAGWLIKISGGMWERSKVPRSPRGGVPSPLTRCADCFHPSRRANAPTYVPRPHKV